MDKNKTRIQLDMSNNHVARLDKIVELTDSVSRSGTIRRALKIYEFLVEKEKEGFKIILMKEKQLIEITPLY